MITAVVRSINLLKNTSKFQLKVPIYVGIRNVGAYEPEGRTTATITNNKNSNVYKIINYSRLGFRLHTQAFVIGPMIIHKNNIFCWNIKGDDAINEDSLEIFWHIVPPLDLLIIGVSEDRNLPKLVKTVVPIVKKHGISVDILPSEKAVSTYNFVTGIRNVAGAFVPPRHYTLFMDECYESRKRGGIEEGRICSDGDREYIVGEARKLGIKP